VLGRRGEEVPHHTDRSPAGALVLLADDRDPQPGPNVLAILRIVSRGRLVGITCGWKDTAKVTNGIIVSYASWLRGRADRLLGGAVAE
jgi:hypothetical protein